MYDNGFKYTIIDDIDTVFEEKENMFGAIRKIAWGDPSSPKFKPRFEIRRWINDPNKGEMVNKGYTFLTDEGPSELTKGLLQLGFGNTREVIDIISSRDDFRKSLNSVLGKDDEAYDESFGTLEDDFFDPRTLLGE